LLLKYSKIELSNPGVVLTLLYIDGGQGCPTRQRERIQRMGDQGLVIGNDNSKLLPSKEGAVPGGEFSD
jgi:hypothetical protein